MTIVDSDYDVVVVGAGPAGSAVAQRLARQGCEVLLLEKSRFDTLRVGESLAPAVQPLLAELGTWEDFKDLDPLPSWGTQSLWGDSRPQVHSHIISPYGCGWHVNRQDFDWMLARAAARAGAQLWCGARLAACECLPDGRWSLSISESDARRNIRARVLIDASGRSAKVSKSLGAERILLDRLVGVAMKFDFKRSDFGCFTMVEAMEEGWWYTAPINGDHLIAMMMADSDLCGITGLAKIDTWLSSLNETLITADRIGNAPMSWATPRVFQAVSQRLQRKEFTRPWFAVGDAALGVDPISGSGVVRSLNSAKAGARLAMDLLEGGAEPAVREYEHRVNTLCDTYLQERAMYYGAEQRWGKSLFWQRRRPKEGEAGRLQKVVS